MQYLKFICFLCLLLLMPTHVQAQGHGGFCDQADSTAATQDCLKRHLKSAQNRLNKIYKKLGDELEAEKLTELQDLQKSWLAYRDAECMWEAERSATPSLKRVNELSCMARVTEDRADILMIAHADGDQENSRREYGSFPRWMNVLTKDNPGVFWNYGHRPSYDLDCDDEDEHVMTGVITSAQKTEKTEDEDNKEQNFSQTVVVAVVQDPAIGRPAANIFKFPVMLEDGSNSVCHGSVTVDFGQKKEEKVAEGEGSEQSKELKTCQSYLSVKSKGCDPKTIIWTGKNFVLEVEEEPEEKEQKK